MVGALGEAHAKHIFDWDSMHASQSLFLQATGVSSAYTAAVSSFFPRASAEEATAALAPLFSDVLASGAEVISNTTTTKTINTILNSPDDPSGTYGVVGSRLIPQESFKSPNKFREVYKRLADVGTTGYVHLPV